MKAEFLIGLFAASAASLFAQDFAITGSHGVYTAVPLQTPPSVYRSSLPWSELEMIEAAFTNGTQPLATLAQRVNCLGLAGGFKFIEEHGFDPTHFSDPDLRAAFASVIDAIDYDNRLSNLVDDINAAIDDENKRAQQPPPGSKAWQEAVEESERKARLYFPDIYFPDSRLTKKWVELRDQMLATGAFPNTPHYPFILTVRAARLLGIPPVKPAVSP